MNLKNNKGITGIDISVALGILIIFVSAITSLSYNFVTSSRNIERKSKATYLAIEVIENIKEIDYNSIIDQMSVTDVEQLSGREVNKYDGYSLDITSRLYGESDVLKIVTVKVEYKVGKSIENVEISTAIPKE
ncbi:hypothetical protein D3C72_1572700 [compost metagenome]